MGSLFSQEFVKPFVEIRIVNKETGEEETLETPTAEG